MDLKLIRLLIVLVLVIGATCKEKTEDFPVRMVLLDPPRFHDTLNISVYDQEGLIAENVSDSMKLFHNDTWRAIEPSGFDLNLFKDKLIITYNYSESVEYSNVWKEDSIEFTKGNRILKATYETRDNLITDVIFFDGVYAVAYKTDSILTREAVFEKLELTDRIANLKEDELLFVTEPLYPFRRFYPE